MLLKDINPNGGSNPSGFTNLNGMLYFSAYDGTNTNLWKSDGSTGGTVNINPSVFLDFNANLFNAGGTLFFRGYTNFNSFESDVELWKTDGTTIKLVKDINVGSSGSYPNDFTYFNGFLYFTANDGINGTELWKSDGTTGGTTLVKDIFSGYNSSSPSNLTAVGNKLFFSAYSSLGNELWVTDGTTAGTILVKDIYTGSNNSSNPNNLVSNGTTLFFAADDGANGTELWRSDGTVGGTYMLNNINPGPAIISGSSPPASSNPQNIITFGTILFFSAIRNEATASNNYGRELFSYNTSTSTLTLIKNINPQSLEGGISDNYRDKFQVIGSSFYFPANDGQHGTELWRSDGTTAGTFMVNDLFVGLDDGLTEYSKFYTDTGASVLYFQATNGQNGRELWSFAYCPSSLNINTTVATNTQKQQASNTLISSSNIADTDFTQGNLTVTYSAGNSITLLPGFQAIAKQFSVGDPVISVRETVFKANVVGCN